MKRARHNAPVRLAPGGIPRLGLIGIRTRTLRAALSALGVSIGIATLILVIGIPASSQRALAENLNALGPNLLRAEPMPDREPPVRFDPDAVGAVRRIGPVTGVSAVANTHAQIRRSDRVPESDGAGLSVLAARTDLLPAVHAEMAPGRFLDRSAERFPTVVLGRWAAQRLGVLEVRAGKATQLAIGDTWFTVIGILAPVPLASDLDGAALVGWNTARDRLDFDGRPTALYVRANEDRLEKVRDVLAAALPEGTGLVNVSRPSDALAAKRATESAFSALFLGLGAMALLVGGIGVANTMVISVLERRREIGLRRALGANRGQIRCQFLTESVVLSGLGGVAGVTVGTVATLGYAVWRDWPAVIPLASTAAGFGGALLAGVAAGVYPAIRAARSPPSKPCPHRNHELRTTGSRAAQNRPSPSRRPARSAPSHPLWVPCPNRSLFSRSPGSLAGRRPAATSTEGNPVNQSYGHCSRAVSLPLAAAIVVISGCASASTDRAAAHPAHSPTTVSRTAVTQPETDATALRVKPATYTPTDPQHTTKTSKGYLVNTCVPKRLWDNVTTLTTKDKKHLSALILGKGPNAVYFGHQYGGQICNFLDLAAEFVKRGYRVILPEFRNHVASEKSETSSSLDANAAFDKLKEIGTKRVFLAGASCGGTTAAVEGVKSGIPVVGLTLLSSPARCDGDAVAAAKKIKQPSLFVVSHKDMQGAHERQIREIYEASAAPDKRLITIDGEAHGTAMLYGSKKADALRVKVINFIADTYAAAVNR